MISATAHLDAQTTEYPGSLSVEATALSDNHALASLAGSRLSARLFLVVFLSIIAIETAVLPPSYLSFRRDLEDRLEHVGWTIVVMAFKPRGQLKDRDPPLIGEQAVGHSELGGGVFWR